MFIYILLKLLHGFKSYCNQLTACFAEVEMSNLHVSLSLLTLSFTSEVYTLEK